MIVTSSHKVITGVTCILNNNGLNITFSDMTIVKFHEIENSDINYYVEKYKPFDKSGSYGIQDFSSIFVSSINGCYFNVVGLPLSTLFYYLKKFKLVQFP